MKKVYYFPSIALLLFASWHFYLHKKHFLLPGSGSGFTMFSAFDITNFKFYLISEDGRIFPVSVPLDDLPRSELMKFKKLYERIMIFPEDASLRRAAKIITFFNWGETVVKGENGKPDRQVLFSSPILKSKQNEKIDNPVMIKELVFEVWRTSFNSKKDEAISHRILERKYTIKELNDEIL